MNKENFQDKNSLSQINFVNILAKSRGLTPEEFLKQGDKVEDSAEIIKIRSIEPKAKYASDEKNVLQKFKDPSAMISIYSSNLTAVQMKNWLALLYNSRNNIRDLTHEISVEKLIELSGYCKKDVNYLKEELRKLTVTGIEFNLLNKSKKALSGRVTALLAGANFDKKPGYVVYQFSEILKEVLEAQDIFALLSLAIVRNIETKTALCLYRLANDYRGIGSSPDIPIETCKGMLGAGKNEYLEIKDFNKKLLNPALKHLKEKTDLSVTPKFKRINRKIVSVKFEIKQKLMKPCVKI